MTYRPQFDSLGNALLDGVWDFFPGDHTLSDLDEVKPEQIRVPGLWEAQGHLELDDAAWYRRSFELDDVEGQWTLRFGAVMDVADVYLNGHALGGHELPFTPFEFDAKPALQPGLNTLAVRVFDPPLGDPEHLRLPHGKQGWMNHVFPSRPSLYLTYGGIWQSVQLRRHGPVVARDVFVNGDPDDLVLTVELENRVDESVTAVVGLRILGSVEGFAVTLGPGASTTRSVRFGATDAARWSPESPVLHETLVDVSVDGQPSDLRSARFGLRTVRVDGTRLCVNDEPYRMRSALVQGFSAERLYAEDDRATIEREVALAKAMGFNTLRLHIKAFDPVYLDVCDEMGMFVHCDLPVAEPIEHEEMGGDTVLVRRCVQAITEQVRRDRNHPSIILWSAMNELCDGRREARQWPEYEHFARTLVAAVQDNDPTRPVIENDWVEPDPDRVFVSPILTAHWYGQLHADYFDKIETACMRWSGLGRPFFVSEFGDWGLPHMPALDAPAFWDTRAIYETALAANLWPDTIGRFVQETQRYQGLTDRLQIEVWRRHDDIGGYCLTELTDVPHELNGLLDLHRRPKPLAVLEVTRANQTVLPMLELRTLVAVAGESIEGVLRVANDGPALSDVEIDVRFGDSWQPLPDDAPPPLPEGPFDLAVLRDRYSQSIATMSGIESIPEHRVSYIGRTSVVAPAVPGNHDLVVRLRAAGEPVAENRYPIHVVDQANADVDARVVGDGLTAVAVAAAGGRIDNAASVVVIGEGDLDADAGAVARDVLARGGVALVLAQPREAAAHFPLPVELTTVVTAWGSTVFHFTTDHGALQSLPRRNLLVGEDSTVQATSVVTAIGDAAFPDTPVVLAFKPVPSAMAGTIVGATDVGPGRLVFCQYRLVERAAQGDAAARALLADLLRWAAEPRRVMHKREYSKADGRRVTAYRWTMAAAR
jgi:hypothetical protein